MARFSFSIPDYVAELLDRDVKSTGKSRSSLIAEYVERYYEGETQRAKNADIVQRVKSEHEKRVQQLLIEHDAEMQQIRTECQKQVTQSNTDNAANTQQFEDELEKLESVAKRLDSELKEANERNHSLMEQLQREKNSKDVVTTGLQHEIELLQQRIASLEGTLHTERGHLSELRQDKEQLQKQLELVTLRLPAPRVGFWARLFGGRTKKED